MPAYNTYNTMNGVPRTNNGYYANDWNANNWGGYSQPQPQQVSADGKTYVNGRAGAEAYPLPRGVNFLTLWDADSHRFFVKGYDNNGIPRVLEDNDYMPHVEPETHGPDLSMYATKDDIRSMISEAFGNLNLPNMNVYVTRHDFEKALSELSLGNGGRIVRNNEPNG